MDYINQYILKMKTEAFKNTFVDLSKHDHNKFITY